MNTGTARIIIVLALIVGGAVVLLNGFADSGDAAAAPSGDGGGAVTPTDSPTPATTTKSTKPPAPETPKPAAPGDTVVAVFNGTNTPGLGSTVRDDVLVPDDYLVPSDAQDAPTKPVTKTIVYYVGGPDAAQSQSNATDISDTYFDGAKVQELDPDYEGLIDRGVQVVVVVGENYKL